MIDRIVDRATIMLVDVQRRNKSMLGTAEHECVSSESCGRSPSFCGSRSLDGDCVFSSGKVVLFVKIV